MNFLRWLEFFGWHGGTVQQVNDELERRAKLHPLLMHELEILIETIENKPEPGNEKLVLARAKTVLVTARSPL
jgi:hypothetical protein